jgi:stage III sporulation protein AG
MGFLRRLFKKWDRKAVVNTSLLLLAGLFALYVGGRLSPKPEKAAPEDETVRPAAHQAENREHELERRLEETLSLVKGAGKVKVMVTMGRAAETIAAKNETSKVSETNEKDAEGGARGVISADTHSEYVIIKQKDGTEAPLTLKTSEAEVAGVCIVAEGGDDIAVKDALTRAAYTVLGVHSHKVLVVKMKKQ